MPILLRGLAQKRKLLNTFYKFYNMPNTNDDQFIIDTIIDYNNLKYPNPNFIKWSDVISQFGHLGINEKSLKRYVEDKLIRTQNVEVLVNGRAYDPVKHPEKDTRITQYYAEEDFEFASKLQSSRLLAEKQRGLKIISTTKGRKLIVTDFIHDKIEISYIRSLASSNENVFKRILLEDLKTKFSESTMQEILKVYPDLS